MSYERLVMVIIPDMAPEQKSFPVLPGVLLVVGFLASCGQREALLQSSVEATPTTAVSELPGADSPVSSNVLQAAISSSADAIINGINLRRAQNGLAPLVIEPGLVEAAYERSTDMAVREYLDHIAPGESQVTAETVFNEQGYQGQAAELVLSTQAALDEVASITLDAWFRDEDHRAVLLSPDLRYAGLGLMGDGTQWIVTVMLVEARP